MLLGKYWQKAKQTKAGFISSEGSGFVMGQLIRPISFLVTPLFLRAGVSANQVTLLAGTVGSTALICIAIGTTTTWTIGAALFLVYALLDAVDGNIARFRDSASYLGKFLDGSVDTFVISAVALAAGWGAYQGGAALSWLAVGAFASFFSLLGFYVMTRYSWIREWMKNDILEGRVRLEPGAPPSTPLRTRIPGSLLLDVTSVGLIVSIYPGAREAFLAILALLLVGWSASGIRADMLTARATLDVWRRSRHSSGYVVEPQTSANQDTETMPG
jgi:phosphatidylglycerophosphate synthase